MYDFSWIFALACSLVLPIALAVELCVRRKGSWKPLLFGALTFTVFQGFLRVPMLAALEHSTGFTAFESASPALYAMFLGATAAFFQEGGRWLVMRFLLKKQRGLRDGFAFGVGHGGIEAIVVLGMTAVTTLSLGSGVSEEDWSIVLAEGVERLAVLTLQIGLSVMVMKSVREKKPLLLLAAFGIHFLAECGVVCRVGFLGDRSSIWAVEFAIVLIAGLMLFYTRREWKAEKTGTGEKDGPNA